MLRYELGTTHVSEIRFAVSQLTETALSMRALTAPGRYPLQEPWLERIAPVRSALDVEALGVLVNGRGAVADFVLPRPPRSEAAFDDELADVLQSPPERILRDLIKIHGTVPAMFSDDVAAAMARTAAALTLLWQLCVQPCWPRMLAVLRGDLAHRSRVQSRNGAGAMLNGLTSSVRYTGQAIDVQLSRATPRPHHVSGRGLVLSPSMFVARATVPNDDTAAPRILYPARGQGTMWTAAPSGGRTAVASVLGRTRTRLLETLEGPMSSTDLATLTGVTASAVNQHLRALHQAGLLGRDRAGHSVLYYRSDVADALLRPK